MSLHWQGAWVLTTSPDMLTPIDQPLDKLEDLKPDEMYVIPVLAQLNYA